MMKKIFVISSYKSENTKNNIKTQIKVTDMLMNNGLTPFVPLFYNFKKVNNINNIDWMDIDFESILLCCDCLLRLKDEYIDIEREKEYAKTLGIPIFFVENNIESTIEDIKNFYN